MKRIGILGNIGSGKSYVARIFGYPVFNADKEVNKLYNNNKTIFFKLKKGFSVDLSLIINTLKFPFIPLRLLSILRKSLLSDFQSL